MLSDAKLRAAKPDAKDYKLSDEKGLFLLVKPHGARYWRFKYRLHGKEKLLALGKYPETSLAEARAQRDAARALVKAGLDPVAAKREAQRQAQLRTANSFEAIARAWHDKEAARWSAGHAERVILSLEQDLFPPLGFRPIAELTTTEILDALRAVERRGALDVTGRLAQRCGAIFRYAVQSGLCERNPCHDLRGALKTRKVTHRPALNKADLPEFMAALAGYSGRDLTRHAMRLLALTFVRPGELRGARWEEFDIDGATWRIPAERMKMRAEHIVPLSRQALAVIDQVRPLSGRYPLLFPSERNPHNPMSENTLLGALYRMGYHSRATAHGFRATASTILNEAGFDPDVIERQLAHIESNKVRAAYHRTEYLAERQRMMQWWADHLDGITPDSNVIPFARGR